MDKKRAAVLNLEYETSSTSYRILARKYGMSLSSVARMIKKRTDKELKAITAEAEALQNDLPDDVKLLKEEIRKLRLKVALQDLIIEISGKELGVDLRKKPGTRQSC